MRSGPRRVPRPSPHSPLRHHASQVRSAAIEAAPQLVHVHLRRRFLRLDPAPARFDPLQAWVASSRDAWEAPSSVRRARAGRRRPGRAGRAGLREVQGADGRRRRDQRRGHAARGRRAGAGDPHLLAVQHARRDDHAEPRERRPRRDVRAARLRPRRRRRARHAQLVGLLGLRRSRRAAVGRRPRQLPGEPAVVERQGRDDRRLLRRHHRQHGRGARRRRAGARGDRARGGDLALVRLRLRRRGALLPQLGGRRPTRASTRRSPSTSASPARRRPTRATRCSPRSSRAARTPASPSSTRCRATTARPTTTTSGASATT